MTLPDVLADLKTYLIGIPELASLTGPRVWFRIPNSVSGAPFMRIYRVGGGLVAGEVPADSPRISHEVWGLVNTDYDAVRLTVRTLKSIYQAASNVAMGANTILQEAMVTGEVDSPDPDTGRPRIVLDVQLTAISAS